MAVLWFECSKLDLHVTVTCNKFMHMDSSKICVSSLFYFSCLRHSFNFVKSIHLSELHLTVNLIIRNFTLSLNGDSNQTKVVNMTSCLIHALLQHQNGQVNLPELVNSGKVYLLFEDSMVTHTRQL